MDLFRNKIDRNSYNGHIWYVVQSVKTFLSTDLQHNCACLEQNPAYFTSESVEHHFINISIS